MAERKKGSTRDKAGTIRKKMARNDKGKERLIRSVKMGEE